MFYLIDKEILSLHSLSAWFLTLMFLLFFFYTARFGESKAAVCSTWALAGFRKGLHGCGAHTPTLSKESTA